MSIPIGKFLKDSVEHTLLRECLMCKRDLVETNEPYIIEKAMKRFPDLEVEETLFEFCMCMPCHQKGFNEISEESRESVQNFFMRHTSQINEGLHQRGLIKEEDDFFKECLITQNKKEDLQEYQVFAYCQGTQIDSERGAFMLSGEIIEQLAELLSKKTRDHLDDFMDNNFGLPPELRALLKKNPLMAL